MSRAIRRLNTLSDTAVLKDGEERDLIVRTLLKILDECSDDEYDIATSGNLRSKLIAAGIVFDEH